MENDVTGRMVYRTLFLSRMCLVFALYAETPKPGNSNEPKKPENVKKNICAKTYFSSLGFHTLLARFLFSGALTLLLIRYDVLNLLFLMH